MTDLDLLQNVRLKFTSGNGVPVPEARVTKVEWEAIERILQKEDAIVKACNYVVNDARATDLLSSGLMSSGIDSSDLEKIEIWLESNGIIKSK